jgi:hypothetical protein
VLVEGAVDVMGAVSDAAGHSLESVVQTAERSSAKYPSMGEPSPDETSAAYPPHRISAGIQLL